MSEKKGNQKSVNEFLDFCLKGLELKNDAALSRALEVAPPVISKFRNARLNIGDCFLARVQEAFELKGKAVSLRTMREMAKVPFKLEINNKR